MQQMHMQTNGDRQMIKVMVVEDEPEIRRLLVKMIEKKEGFSVVCEADSNLQAVSLFSKNHPQVVFVDVDLNGENGLECAKIMTEINPKVKIIFATAHSEYMANAFEIYAFDYLLKPFKMERITKTLSRIEEMLKETENLQEQNEVSAGKESDRLLVKGREQMYFLDKTDIIFVERENGVTNLVTKEGVYHTSSSLGDIEEKLPVEQFMRCHKSYIINIGKISSVEPYGRWTYVVKFKGIAETALITNEKYNEIKDRFK